MTLIYYLKQKGLPKGTYYEVFTNFHLLKNTHPILSKQNTDPAALTNKNYEIVASFLLYLYIISAKSSGLFCYCLKYNIFN